MRARVAAGGNQEASELVEQARRGDRRAFERLVDLHKDRIVSYVSRMLRDPVEAQDVAQEAFVRAWESLPSFRGASSFQTWLYRIASNLAIDSARARKRRGDRSVPLDETLEPAEGDLEKQLPDEHAGPEDIAVGEDVQRVVREAIAELSPRLRSVIVLYDLQGMSYQEISQILGCPLGTVKSRLFNARGQLKGLLESKLGAASLASP
jgi:RNA polymerase sigma-70 factor, ECF subfamily